jgi:hypothetical protein
MLINLIINKTLDIQHPNNEVAVCMANENGLKENSDNRLTLKVRSGEINDEQKVKNRRKGVRTKEKKGWKKWEETEKIRIMDH